MEIIVMMAHRRESYPGEYGVEALDARSEFDDEENPDYLREKQLKHQKSGEFSRVLPLRFEVNEGALKARLRGGEASQAMQRNKAALAIHLLIAQPHCAYPGELGLSCLDAMTEYDMDGNPAYLEDKLREARASGDYEAAAIVVIETDESAIINALYPERTPLSTVVSGHPHGGS